VTEKKLGETVSGGRDIEKKTKAHAFPFCSLQPLTNSRCLHIRECVRSELMNRAAVLSKTSKLSKPVSAHAGRGTGEGEEDMNLPSEPTFYAPTTPALATWALQLANAPVAKEERELGSVIKVMESSISTPYAKDRKKTQVDIENPEHRERVGRKSDVSEKHNKGQNEHLKQKQQGEHENGVTHVDKHHLVVKELEQVGADVDAQHLRREPEATAIPKLNFALLQKTRGTRVEDGGGEAEGGNERDEAEIAKNLVPSPRQLSNSDVLRGSNSESLSMLSLTPLSLSPRTQPDSGVY